MPKKKTTSKKKKGGVILNSFPKWLEDEAERRGITVQEAATDLFSDGFLVYIHETAKGRATIKYVNLWGSKAKEKSPSELKELRRLRKEFAPVSSAVDFHKNFLLGSGIDVKIDNPRDNFKKEIREYIKKFIRDVYQDIYTKGLNTILDIMVDEALTVGAAAAEIVFDKEIDFLDYAEPEEVILADGTKELTYKITEPNWKTEKFGGIRRLKIINNAIERLKLYRHPQSLEALFWTIDEEQAKLTAEDIAMGKRKKKRTTLESATKLHIWQVFWLVINRRNWDYIGESIITPAVKLSQILEKIQEAIGEGIYRAGNKKYFIVCGTEKRPWGDPWIRNVLQMMKEMGEKNWTSMPVPAGFDIKEIGGQVFEGRDVIDHFVAMIATAMDAPKEIIDVGRRGRTSDKPWVVSGVGHRRRQKALENIIITQLFAPHIWCKYGKKKQKQGGKGEVEIYIPEIKWLREDEFSKREHIDIIMKGLNVANPLNPLVKLEMERDFCKIMGYDDVLLPTQEELAKELEELEKQQKKEAKKKEKKAEEKLPTQKGPQKSPEPPTEEKVKKRLKKGAHKALKPSEGPVSKKGQSKPMGSTRKPRP